MLKIRQFVILLTCVFVLFILSYQNYQTAQTFRLESISSSGYINKERISPKDLFLESWALIKSAYWDTDMNTQNWARWKKRYTQEIESDEDVYLAVNTMLASLDDPYSKFLNSKEFTDQNVTMDSKIYGIGVNITSVSGKIYIANVLKGAPADLAGIKQGDMLLKIDNTAVDGKSLYQVAQYIKGSLGASVELEIMRGGEKLTKKIKRGEIKVKTVEYKLLEDNIAYISILSFISHETPQEFINALNDLSDSKAMILDLRGNTGGLFQNAVFISNLFLQRGKIVSVIGRGGGTNIYSANKEDFVYKKPLVVLVDGDSASASEIVAGALSDNGRAKLVGEQTFGKGLVQKVFAMPNECGLNLTIARYLTPNGTDINKKGIAPDFTIEIKDEDYANSYDRQLVYAIATVQKELGQKGELVKR